MWKQWLAGTDANLVLICDPSGFPPYGACFLVSVFFLVLLRLMAIWDLPGHVLGPPKAALCGWTGAIVLSLTL